MNQAHPPKPRVFISYSWTSDEHIDWVTDLAERLMADGVDIVLDQWSLKDGQDVTSFMEQMVVDPTIKRVLIISDAEYARKADARTGGVGTESQIISPEVYKKADQEKFIPIVRERDAEGKACLPIFLKSRKYIEFSTSDAEAKEYDQLLRNIFERPVRQKPPLGQPPAHLFDDTATVIPSAQKAKRFREVLSSQRGNPSAAFEEFAGEFIANFNDLRLTFSREDEQAWCDTVLANIENGRQYRDVCLDALRPGIAHARDEWFVESLLSFLEGLLPFQFRSKKTGIAYTVSEDNYKFLLYELFLYIFAAFVKSRRYDDATRLLEHTYVCPEYFDSDDNESFDFSQFNERVPSLDEVCNKQKERNLLSFTADLIVHRATRRDIRLADIVQADVLCSLAGAKRSGYHAWYPQTLIYASRIGKLELFARATNKRGLAPLKALIPVSDAAELVSLVTSESMNRLLGSEIVFRSGIHVGRVLNLEDIERAWDLANE